MTGLSAVLFEHHTETVPREYRRKHISQHRQPNPKRILHNYFDSEAMVKNATEEEWQEHFKEPLRTGRVPGETLDFFILVPLAEQAEKGEWKKSKLEDVKNYILEQM